jgi:dUTP pyrophosphatase
VKLSIQRLDPELPLPSYAQVGDAGLDLFCAETTKLLPGERAAIPTGIAVAVPQGFAGFVQAKSGRALKEGLALVNAPGLIDAGYRGEIKAIVINLSDVPVEIAYGQKIAQLVIQPVERAELEEVTELPGSERGAGGFGSTGV